MANAGNFVSTPSVTRRSGVGTPTTTLIERYKLKADILKCVEPGNSTSYTKLLRFANVCFAVGESTRGRKTLERILENRPNDVSTRLRLLLMTDDPEQQRKFAQGFTSRSLGQLSFNLQQVVNDSSITLSKRLPGVRRDPPSYRGHGRSPQTRRCLAVDDRTTTGQQRSLGKYEVQLAVLSKRFTNPTAQATTPDVEFTTICACCCSSIRPPRSTHLRCCWQRTKWSVPAIANFTQLAFQSLSMADARRTYTFSYPSISLNGRKVEFPQPHKVPTERSQRD